jgi:hypothetical protein
VNVVADVPPGAVDRGRAVFGELIEGRWEQTRGKLRQDIRGHADTGQLIALEWAPERAGEPSARQFGEYTVVELPLTFNAGEGTGRVALDQEGRIAGLFLQCPRRGRLDPRVVRTLLFGIPEARELLRRGRPHRFPRPARPASNP